MDAATSKPEVAEIPRGVDPPADDDDRDSSANNPSESAHDRSGQPTAILGKPIKRHRPRNPLLGVLLACCAGMIVDRALAIPFVAWIVAAFALAIAACVWRRQDRTATVLLACCIAATGGGWHHADWYSFAKNDLYALSDTAPQPAAVMGTVATLPETRPPPDDDPLQIAFAGERTRFDLDVDSLRRGKEWIDAAGTTSVLIEGRRDNLLPGDRIEIFGQLSRNQPPGNPGEFDFAAYYRADRTLTNIRAPQLEGVTMLEQGDTVRWKRMVANVRSRAAAVLHQHFPSAQAGFASALLIGQREHLGQSRRDAFLRSGAMHFLAISGLHVGILASGLFLLLRLGFVNRRLALAGVMLITAGYVILSGAHPPAVRSLVLVLIACGSLWMHRPAATVNVLSLAGLTVLAFNPADLFRTGPQLSFLAVLTLFAVAPRCAKLFATRDPLKLLIWRYQSWPRRGLRWLLVWYIRGVAISTVIWLATLPLVAARFHVIAPISTPLGPLLWPLVAIALLSGFGVLIFAGWLAPAASVFAAVCGTMLSALDAAVGFAADLPLGHVWVSGPDEWWLAVFYAVFLLALLGPRSKLARRIVLVTLGVWFMVGGYDALTTHERPRGELRCAVLSMRHGCCVVVELPDKQVLMYDAGRLGSPRGAAESVSAYLWHRGITTVDKTVISHDDADHFNAIPRLLDRQFDLGEVVIGPGMLDGDLSPATAALRTSLREHNVPLREIHAGQVLLQSSDPDHPYSVRVLHPPAEPMSDDGAAKISDNARSVVLVIEYAGRRILLPGDIDSPGLEPVLAMPEIDSDILLAPHHGSSGSNPRGFSERSSPEFTVISGARSANVDDVMMAYQSAGAKVFQTAQNGAVSFVIDSRGETRVFTHLRPDRNLRTTR